jgi:hypothetical protein
MAQEQVLQSQVHCFLVLAWWIQEDFPEEEAGFGHQELCIWF